MRWENAPIRAIQVSGSNGFYPPTSKAYFAKCGSPFLRVCSAGLQRRVPCSPFVCSPSSQGWAITLMQGTDAPSLTSCTPAPGLGCRTRAREGPCRAASEHQAQCPYLFLLNPHSSLVRQMSPWSPGQVTELLGVNLKSA